MSEGILLLAHKEQTYIAAPREKLTPFPFGRLPGGSDAPASPSNLAIRWVPNRTQERFAFAIMDDATLEEINTNQQLGAEFIPPPVYYFGVANRASRRSSWKVIYLPQYRELCGSGFAIELVGWANDRWMVTLQNKETKPSLVAYDTVGDKKVVLMTLPKPVTSYVWVQEPSVAPKPKQTVRTLRLCRCRAGFRIARCLKTPRPATL